MTGLAQGEDLDGGTTVLESPRLDASDPAVMVSFDVWYDNDDDEDLLIVNVSSDGGNIWRTLEVIRSNGGGWVHYEYLVSQIQGIENTDNFVLQFRADDRQNPSTVEAAVDAIQMSGALGCEESCSGDVDGSGDVGFDDVLLILAAWGPCEGCPEDLDGDDDVDFDDLLIALAGWGPCE